MSIQFYIHSHQLINFTALEAQKFQEGSQFIPKDLDMIDSEDRTLTDNFWQLYPHTHLVIQ